MPITDHPLVGNIRMINIKRFRIIYMIILIVLAFLFAPYIWNFVNTLLVEPASETWLLINQLIRLIPQTNYWLFIVGSFGVITIIFILASLRKPHRSNQKLTQTRGPIKSLADYYSMSEESHYFKWVIANRLAQITQEILQINQGNSKNNKLHISESELPDPVKNYLLAGSDNSHMSDKPRKFLFRKQGKSPLDIEINNVINTIESQME